jgi:outer membrane protein OmpA-like peptidoglycan-associated protein
MIVQRSFCVEVFALLVLALAPVALCAQDAEGCKDSPLITRMPGSTISNCDHQEFAQATMSVGKTGDPVDKTVAGDFQHWTYTTREGVSQLQVFRNIEDALKLAGFQIDYENVPEVLTAHKANAWYSLENKGDYYDQIVVKTQEMVQEVQANATGLSDEINKSGHVAVYGIHFDTAKATILPDSESVLSEIAKLMQGSPDLKIRVEGHTDSQGVPSANQVLSEKRAQAVVAWLTAHGVAAARLSAKGFGQDKPVADNSTEEGRAKNRRVELAKM